MIKNLELSNFRVFEAAALPRLSKSVILLGGNGQGKSSVLEAIFLLSNLRSFRTSQLRELKRFGAEVFSASCEITRSQEWSSKLEFRSDAFSKQLKVDGIPVSKASDFARRFKTVAFLPDDPILASGPSQLRRRFMDMFISMVAPDYFVAIQKYFSALKSRNYMLKSGRFDNDVMASFSQVMASSGAKVNADRRLFLSKLSEAMAKNALEIRPEFSKLNLRLKCPEEYDSEKAFLERLERDFSKDRQKGASCFGPHLDDFEISVDSKNLRSYGSRGQCRIAALCLKLAELEMVLSSSDVSEAVVLVDDATGDLDPKAKASFFERVARAGQVFYAFTSYPEESILKDSQRFKIDDGKITLE